MSATALAQLMAATGKMSWCKKKEKQLRSRSKCNNLNFNVSYLDILNVFPLNNKCPILNINFKYDDKYQFASIDRIIPELGYVKNNIQVISTEANYMKRDATIAELKSIIKYLENHFNRQKNIQTSLNILDVK